MDKKIFILLIVVLVIVAVLISIYYVKNKKVQEINVNGISESQDNINVIQNENTNTQTEQKLLGGLTPEDALEYMKKTENLVVIEVNAPEWKIKNGFTGAMWIPYTEMAERYNEIPTNRPVLLHCGAGVVSVPAYETLQEKRPDIPELGYIDGTPPIAEYNEWLANK